MDSVLYDMKEFVASAELFSEALLIVAVDEEARSKYVLSTFMSYQDICRSAIIFTYGKQEKFAKDLQSIESVIGKQNIIVIERFNNSQSLRKESKVVQTKKQHCAFR